jgi:hypothetical protein
MSGCSIEAVKEKTRRTHSIPHIAHRIHLPFTFPSVHIPPPLSMFSSRSHTLELIQALVFESFSSSPRRILVLLLAIEAFQERRDQSIIPAQSAQASHPSSMTQQQHNAARQPPRQPLPPLFLWFDCELSGRTALICGHRGQSLGFKLGSSLIGVFTYIFLLVGRTILLVVVSISMRILYHHELT